MKKNTKIWNALHVSGYITACDPGCLNTSGSHKAYNKEELYKGMNLCAYDENLPEVRLLEIYDEYVVVSFSGSRHKVEIGHSAYTPQKGLSYAYSEAIISLARLTKKQIEDRWERLVELYQEMVKNYNEFGELWRNIPLGIEAFDIMQEMPDTVKDCYDGKVEKSEIMTSIISYMDETLTPRLCIEMREYVKSLYSGDKDNNEELQKLQDFIDTEISVEEYCRKYEKMLMFDPVERTEEWEKVIYEVEKECAEILKDEPKGMGFCFGYWSTKAAVLGRHGIEWRSPSSMNPRVHFD